MKKFIWLLVGLGMVTALGLAWSYLAATFGPCATRSLRLLISSTPATCRAEIIRVYPHDRTAFTEGLAYVGDDELYEGTGTFNLPQSWLRSVRLETGEVLQQAELPAQFFGEGVTVLGEHVYQLTWQSHLGFVYDRATFQVVRTFSYPTEGWGLTQDGHRLIMSDGTATLYFIDPETLTEASRVAVSDGAGLVTLLNELEYINGYVYANVWKTSRIAKIDPQSGRVVARIDLTGMYTSPEIQANPEAVLNGIAYDPSGDRLFVTGKLWPSLFQIKLLPKP